MACGTFSSAPACTYPHWWERTRLALIQHALNTRRVHVVFISKIGAMACDKICTSNLLCVLISKRRVRYRPQRKRLGRLAVDMFCIVRNSAFVENRCAFMLSLSGREAGQQD